MVPFYCYYESFIEHLINNNLAETGPSGCFNSRHEALCSGRFSGASRLNMQKKLFFRQPCRSAHPERPRLYCLLSAKPGLWRTVKRGALDAYCTCDADGDMVSRLCRGFEVRSGLSRLP